MANPANQSVNTPEDVAVANILLLFNLIDDDAIWYWRRHPGSLDEYLKTKKLKPGALEMAHSIFAESSEFERNVFMQGDIVRRWSNKSLPENEALVIRHMLTKQAKSSILSVHGPSFWEHNRLISSDGTVQANRMTVFVILCLVLVITWGRMLFAGGETVPTAAQLLTKDIDIMDWYADIIREKHPRKLEGICQRIQEYSLMPDSQNSIDQIIAATDAYLENIKKRDPNFEDADPNRFKLFTAAVKQYQEVKKQFSKGTS